MAFQLIQSETKGGVLVLTMDDPKTRNALGQDMSGELVGELDRFEKDPDLRVVVLTGADPSFCSGANVRNFDQGIRQREQTAAPPPPSAWEVLDPSYSATVSGGRHGPEMVVKLFNLTKPTIAAVNGHAYGIGHGLALSCDFRIASEKALFCEAFIRNGLISADGSCWQLPRLIGMSNTLMLQFTGEPVDAKEAFRIGLCNQVVPHGELMDATMELADKLAHGPTYSMALMKLMVHKAYNQDFHEHLADCGRAQRLAQQTQDHREGVRAFLEKRKPSFVGR